MSWSKPEGELPPLCRFCGIAIKKRTASWHFGRDPRFVGNDASLWFQQRVEKPSSMDELKALVGNGIVVSVRWYRPEGEPAWIDKAGVWDGATYDDGFFCKGEHAQAFGYSAARANMATKEFNAAFTAQAIKAGRRIKGKTET